jgi:RNA polymerase-binding protein DksA
LREKQIKETMDKVKNAHHFENIDEEWGDYTPPIVGFTRYSDADLKMFKDLINKKLADAKEELNFYKEQLIENAMNETDSKSAGLEDGGQTNEKEYLNNMANRQMKFISNLENALIRIENKTYGICRKTGELIDKKRLMAVPHATLSMDAKLGK